MSARPTVDEGRAKPLDIRTATGRHVSTLATSTLRRMECGLCGQQLDRLRKSAGACSSIWHRNECHWHATLNAALTPPSAVPPRPESQPAMPAGAEEA